MVSERQVVLVVDDEAPIRDLFATILESAGYIPVAADTAETALHLIRGGITPDAVLLDLKMPGMGGLAFLVRLRADPVHAAVPVAIVTGDSFMPGVLRAATALDTEVYFKPMNVDAILDLTTRLLSAA